MNRENAALALFIIGIAMTAALAIFCTIIATGLTAHVFDWQHTIATLDPIIDTFWPWIIGASLVNFLVLTICLIYADSSYNEP